MLREVEVEREVRAPLLPPCTLHPAPCTLHPATLHTPTAPESSLQEVRHPRPTLAPTSALALALALTLTLTPTQALTLTLTLTQALGLGVHAPFLGGIGELPPV